MIKFATKFALKQFAALLPSTPLLTDWIFAILQHRPIAAKVDECEKSVNVDRGCPQKIVLGHTFHGQKNCR